MSDQPYSYLTLNGESESLIKEKGSKFLGFSCPVHSEDEAESFLSDIKSLHPKARHHCFAWRMGHPDVSERANDDGEPSGTAGRPILGQLIKANVTNAMIIVVRYFGGTLLGTSGLIQAYKSCAEAALNNARIVRIVEKETWRVEIDFPIVHVFEEWAPRLGFVILERDAQTMQMNYMVEIEKSISAFARTELIAKLLDCYPEEVELEKMDYGAFTLTECTTNR